MLVRGPGCYSSRKECCSGERGCANGEEEEEGGEEEGCESCNSHSQNWFCVRKYVSILSPSSPSFFLSITVLSVAGGACR